MKRYPPSASLMTVSSTGTSSSTRWSQVRQQPSFSRFWRNEAQTVRTSCRIVYTVLVPSLRGPRTRASSLAMNQLSRLSAGSTSKASKMRADKEQTAKRTQYPVWAKSFTIRAKQTVSRLRLSKTGS
jgi:hypothetical protein